MEAQREGAKCLARAVYRAQGVTGGVSGQGVSLTSVVVQRDVVQQGDLETVQL